MSYESPIKVIYDDFVSEVTRKFDNTVITACQNVNIVVDKEELAKALKYDRDQYVKGFKDGEKSAHVEWVSTKKKLPYLYEEVLATTAWNEVLLMKRYPRSQPNEWEWVSTETSFNYEEEEIIAWMSLPEPYKEEEDEAD